MTMTFGAAAKQRNAYGREAVLSATPIRLLTMLYDRLLLDLGRAEAAQNQGSWATASENLVHAQAIVSELTTSLRVELWEGGVELQALYTYVSVALVNANVHRDVALTRESIVLLEPLRQAWHEAAALVPAAPAAFGGSLGVA
ncbi:MULTISPECIES: flagellar export chaperone FliS [unclassified Frondihabitans]|uniref:flagellar export chaperone FliS n=1 Tax=unclassified Frondihabitans TaxID=2626248 RepID=UPI0006F36FDB|nr:MULTISPECIES: flagellar export chaperone FliS [unclassified Frondihabitans]KQQ25671.1 flagellar export chaperone FliS [Frondihabitans sp. Leaf304]MBF4574968.1 flagellar export chaperone FliS [Frondihabitans sp. VKM Ac-2883]RPE77522.1 flagellar protein FliS [Frondihabitans sp. PhB153]RPF07799.1 flagellar protein FliS [Frondihabitans sp. PhB161]